MAVVGASAVETLRFVTSLVIYVHTSVVLTVIFRKIYFEVLASIIKIMVFFSNLKVLS